MKRFIVPCCALSVLFAFAACDDSTPTSTAPLSVHKADAGAAASGVCAPSKCPKPAAAGAVACCTPDAKCGSDPTGTYISCTPNEPDGVCSLKDCPASPLGAACCTPNAQCGFELFNNASLCFPNGPKVDAGPPAKPLCDLTKCGATDGGGFLTCCQANGECGLDVFGLCFPPPPPMCDPKKCPDNDAGAKGCCALNNECGLDLLGVGLCFPPPPEATCDLSKCEGSGSTKACCLPNGKCGLDTFNVGICFPPAPPAVDAGKLPPISTTPPDDPSITGECPSVIGIFGPQWGCCSAYGVCGTFLGNQCAVAVGTTIPTPGPLSPLDAGSSVHRCTVPKK